MSEFSWMRALLAGVSSLAVTGAAETAMSMPAPVQSEAYRFHYEPVLGTTLDLVAMAPDRGTGLLAVNAARSEIARLEKILSSWRMDSEVMRLSKNVPTLVSPDLFAVLQACESWRLQTQNAFDIRLGSVEARWREAAEEGVVPSQAELIARAEACRASSITLNAETREVTVPQDVTLAIDALAKGYIVDAALAAARREAPGMQGMMLNIGGDLRSWGVSPQGGTAWHVGVSAPGQLADNADMAALVALDNRAIATSGIGARDHVIGARAYAHMLSPHSGMPVDHINSATVIARTTADADALATAFSVLPPEQSLALAETLSDVETRIVTKNGAEHISSGWSALTLQQSDESGFFQRVTNVLGEMIISSAHAASDVWPAGYELKVDYEIPRIESSNYKKPYLAIWVTDENKKLVRHLALLGNEQKWIDSNYVWWRRFGRKIPNVVETMTKPTLAPGQHSVVWDGRDDKGDPVLQGRYTIHIEATREHGGHSYRSVVFDVGSKSAEASEAGADELGATRISFGQRG